MHYFARLVPLILFWCHAVLANPLRINIEVEEDPAAISSTTRPLRHFGPPNTADHNPFAESTSASLDCPYFLTVINDEGRKLDADGQERVLGPSALSQTSLRVSLQHPDGNPFKLDRTSAELYLTDATEGMTATLRIEPHSQQAYEDDSGFKDSHLSLTRRQTGGSSNVSRDLDYVFRLNAADDMGSLLTSNNNMPYEAAPQILGTSPNHIGISSQSGGDDFVFQLQAGELQLLTTDQTSVRPVKVASDGLLVYHEIPEPGISWLVIENPAGLQLALDDGMTSYPDFTVNQVEEDADVFACIPPLGIGSCAGISITFTVIQQQ